MRFKLLWGLLLVFGCQFRVTAQHENVWAFGNNVLLDFNRMPDGYPVSGTQRMRTGEGCASVCNADGSLLFYTNGSVVYNRNHEVMQNGTIFASDRSSSSTQGALIVPFPDEQLYYVFNVTHSRYEWNDYQSSLYYSVVDMRLDGGLGAVVAGQKAVYVDTGFSEQLTSVPGLGGDVWVIAGKHSLHSDTSYALVAYNVSALGVFNPVPSVSAGLPNRMAMVGSVNPSPDYTRLVDCRGGITIYRFDRQTGTVHDPLVLPGMDHQDSLARPRQAVYYESVFSPDSRKLYVSKVDGGSARGVFQFDVSNYNVQDIFNSRVRILNSGSGLKLGPDNKVYVIDNAEIHALARPEEPGPDCGLVRNVVALQTETELQFNFPNVINIPGYFKAGDRFEDTCVSAWPYLLRPVHAGCEQFSWSDGSTADHLYADTPGMYLVTYIRGRYYHTDSFLIGPNISRVLMEVQPAVLHCLGYDKGAASVTIGGMPAGAFASYWQTYTGDTLSDSGSVSGLEPGRYRVAVNEHGCSNVIPFVVEEVTDRTFFPFELEVTDVCGTDTLGSARLYIAAGSSLSYVTEWQTGNGEAILRGADTVRGLPVGDYRLYISTLNCDTTLLFSVNRVSDQVSFSVPDTVWCQNADYSVYNTSGSYYHDFFWKVDADTISRNGDSVVLWFDRSGAYVLTLAGAGRACGMEKSVQITVDSSYRNRFAIDRDSICQGESAAFVTEVSADQAGYRWSVGEDVVEEGFPGDRTMLRFDHPGVFAVTLTTGFRACPDSRYSGEIYVVPSPSVNLGQDTVVCDRTKSLTLQNLSRENQDTALSYRWSTGSRMQYITVTDPGTYGLTVTEGLLGCSGQDEVHISKHCRLDLPNVFTPNGDGMNDYFFPFGITDAVVSFRMYVYNRWGQQVYYAGRPDERGWDGRLNGQPVQDGVYVYLVEVVLRDGSGESYQGNVTLLR